MIAQNAFTASKERATELLVSRGYEPVCRSRAVSFRAISRSILSGCGETTRRSA